MPLNIKQYCNDCSYSKLELSQKNKETLFYCRHPEVPRYCENSGIRAINPLLEWLNGLNRENEIPRVEKKSWCFKISEEVGEWEELEDGTIARQGTITFVKNSTIKPKPLRKVEL